MNVTDTSTPTAALDDSALTAHLASLVRHERTHIVGFLRCLAVFDARRVYLGLGYSSLFVYLRDGLRLSKASAYRRFTVARLMSRFPVIADFLEDGRLNLTRVAKLDDVLTAENHLEILNRATVGSEEDVDVIVATLKPKPDATDSIRKAPARGATSAVAPPPRPDADLLHAPTPNLSGDPASVPADRQVPSSLGPAVAAVPEPRGGSSEDLGGLFSSSAAEPSALTRPPKMEVEPTSATSFCVRMRVGPEFLREFEDVKAALSHKFPDGNFEDIFRECFRITMEVIERRRSARTTRCGTTPAAEAPAAASQDARPASETKPRSRYIPAAVRRAVWKRDAGRCAFVSADGKRCDARHQIEFHHLEPFATGGASSADNLSLRCRQHNAYEAALDFGSDFMKARSSGRRRRSGDEQSVPLRNSNEAPSESSHPPDSGARSVKLH